jgi:hypothetical protein
MHNDSLLLPPAESQRPAAQHRPGLAIGAALAVVVAWSGLVAARTKILAAVPAAAPVYAALGIDASGRRISLDSVVSRLSEEDGRRILVVEGEIRNLARGTQTVPRIKLAVLDAAGQEIYRWTAAPPKSRLRAGETAFFRARLAAPPAGGREVRARLAGAQERAGQGS